MIKFRYGVGLRDLKLASKIVKVQLYKYLNDIKDWTICYIYLQLLIGNILDVVNTYTLYVSAIQTYKHVRFEPENVTH